ncbi:MAG: carbohydrate-binding domain-containing protein, partial [Bacteroidaceae bacterium]
SFISDYGVYITYTNGNVKIKNSVHDGGVSISTEGQHVTVNASADDVTYFLSGTSTNGSFTIASSKHSQNVVLNGVTLTNQNGAAINIQSKKKTSIVLPEATTNKLVDGGAADADSSKAALFSEGELVFTGTGGSLYVEGNRKHGICSDDYIDLKSGNIQIKGNVSDGIHVHDYFAISGEKTKLTIETLGDGIDCDRGYIDIYGGTLDLTTGDEGIATTSDSVQLDRDIRIYAGTISIASLSTVDKDLTGYGIRSAGDLHIEGGNITINTKKKAISAGKSDDNDVFQAQKLYIDGGSIICAGTVRPLENLGYQTAIYYGSNTNLSKGSNISFKNSNLETLASLITLNKAKRFFYSSPSLVLESTYSIYNSATKLISITASSALSYIDDSNDTTE